MGLPGTTDSSVYEGLKHVLQRYPRITRVSYEPDTIIKRYLRARIDPNRVVPPTGPHSPRLDVEWRFVENEQYYRIHYADPNTGFNCGWHRDDDDDDHPDLGVVHFQYQQSDEENTIHEPARFEKTIPTEILWAALDRLFEKHISTLSADHNDR